MPVQGSRVDLAIDRAVSLLEQATVMNGSIVLITDSQIGQRDIDAASVAQSKGFTVSVLGLEFRRVLFRSPGGQFVKDGSGAIVVPQLKLNQLQNLTDAGGGSTVSMSSGKQDINALVDLVSGARIERAENSSGQPIAEYWIERTPWLLPLLAFVSLLLFRRGLA